MNILQRIVGLFVPKNLPVVLHEKNINHGGARKKFGPEVEKFVAENYLAMTADQMAAQLDCSPGHIANIKKRLGLRKNTRIYRAVPAAAMARLRAEYANPDFDVVAFADEVGISANTVRTYASIFGLGSRAANGFKLPMHDQLVLVEAYRAGVPTTLLAKEFGLTRQGVANTLVRHDAHGGKTRTLEQLAGGVLKAIREHHEPMRNPANAVEIAP